MSQYGSQNINNQWEDDRSTDNGGTPKSSSDFEIDVRDLAEGDPSETISVPMVHTTQKMSLKSLLRGGPTVSRTVTARRMSRRLYLKHYARDAEGNYVGAEAPAIDAALVYVRSKSTPDDLSRQVRQVAYRREHQVNNMPPADLGTIYVS